MRILHMVTYSCEYMSVCGHMWVCLEGKQIYQQKRNFGSHNPITNTLCKEQSLGEQGLVDVPKDTQGTSNHVNMKSASFPPGDQQSQTTLPTPSPQDAHEHSSSRARPRPETSQVEVPSQFFGLAQECRDELLTEVLSLPIT